MKKDQYVLYLFILLIFGIFIGTGCVSKVNDQNNTNISSRGNIQKNYNSSTDSNNTSSWIIINPIGNHKRTEIFEIDGTTNLGVKEKLRYSISRLPVAVAIPCPTGSSTCPTHYIDGAENIAYGDILILKDGSTEQKWSFLLNASGPEFYKDNYGAFFELNVSSHDMTTHNSAQFLIEY